MTPNTQTLRYSDALWLRCSDEEEWIAQREHDVTESEAATLVGAGPIHTHLELWASKSGLIDPLPRRASSSIWSARLSYSVAAGVCEDNGWTIVDSGPLLHVRSSRFVGMSASPDYVVFCPKRGNLGILNIRTGRPSDYSDLALQFELEACGIEWAAVCSPSDDGGMKVTVRERWHEVGIELGYLVTDFMRRVRDRDMPEPFSVPSSPLIGVYFTSSDLPVARAHRAAHALECAA